MFIMLLRMRKLTRSSPAILLFLAVSTLACAQDRQPPAVPGDDSSFSPAIAERLTAEFRNGLLAEDSRRTLAVFDRNHTPDYNRLAGALASFFDHFQSVRVYYRVLQIEITDNGSRGFATVEFTMEASPYDITQPPVRHTQQLRMEFLRSGADWKIADVQPRGYFESF
jgi:hypothetical protein